MYDNSALRSPPPGPLFGPLPCHYLTVAFRKRIIGQGINKSNRGQKLESNGGQLIKISVTYLYLRDSRSE